jgi:ActR/RegA family two-component response regulator
MKDESNAVSILFLTRDLVFSSRVAGSAARLDMALQTAGTAAWLYDLVRVATRPAVVIVDLDSTEGGNLAKLIEMLRATATPPRAIIAYGPHVQEDRLAAAKAAGCDEVLTRGQFNATMDDVLRKWRPADEA